MTHRCRREELLSFFLSHSPVEEEEEERRDPEIQPIEEED
jgi:hypothetical protein